MTMRFEPKTENELSTSLLWPAGEYDFQVYEAVEGTSKAGNDMIALTLHVHNDDGQRKTVLDWLVDSRGWAYKIRHFAEVTGLIVEYEKGELLALDMVNRTGRVKLSIQKDKTGQYSDKNGVADYLPLRLGRSAPPPARPMSRPAAPAKAMAGGAIDDDEIPF